MALPRRVIFISYRRLDTGVEAGLIAHELQKHVGSKFEVFRDVDQDAINPGDVFQERIDAKLNNSVIMVALIGNQWLDLLCQRSRLKEQDPLEYEIRTALMIKDIVVIPTYVGTTVTLRDQRNRLPERLAPLAELQGVFIARPPKHNLIEELPELVKVVKACLQNTSSSKPAERWARFLKNELFIWRMALRWTRWIRAEKADLLSKTSWKNFRQFPFGYLVLVTPVFLLFFRYFSFNLDLPSRLGGILGYTVSLVVSATCALHAPFPPITVAARYEHLEGSFSDKLFRVGRLWIALAILVWLPTLYYIAFFLNFTGSVDWLSASFEILVGSKR